MTKRKISMFLKQVLLTFWKLLSFLNLTSYVKFSNNNFAYDLFIFCKCDFVVSVLVFWSWVSQSSARCSSLLTGGRGAIGSSALPEIHYPPPLNLQNRIFSRRMKLKYDIFGIIQIIQINATKSVYKIHHLYWKKKTHLLLKPL